MRVLETIQGCPITEESDGQVWFIADADIDADGGSNPDNDPYWQPDTSLHFHGSPLDAESVPFIVVPPVVLRRTRGVVLGCQAIAMNILTMETVKCVVADIGPRSKVGEISPAAARKISVNPNSVTGGQERKIILYKLFPGLRALVNGIEYNLQPYRT